MKVFIVLSALFAVSFAFFLSTKKDVFDCLREGGENTTLCADAYKELLIEYNDELQKHEEDLTKLPEEVKKVLCCGFNDYRFCLVDAVKDIDNCEELVNEYLDKIAKKENLYDRVCVKYHKESC